MGSSNSGGFGIGTIVFMIIMYNIVFNRDDEEKKKDIEVQVAEPQKQEETINESFNKVKKEATKILDNIEVEIKKSTIKEDTKKLANDLKIKIMEETEEEKQNVAKKSEKKEEEPYKLKSFDDEEQDDDGFEKL